VHTSSVEILDERFAQLVLGNAHLEKLNREYASYFPVGRHSAARL